MADKEGEIFQDLGAVLGVHDFRMELQSVEFMLVVEHGGEGAGGGKRASFKARGDRFHSVAVAHPDGDGRGDIFEEGIVLGCFDWHFAVFALFSGNDSAAQDLAHQLHAVADAEDGDAKLKDAFVYRGGVFFEDGVRTAGEDDAFGG